MRRDHIVVLQPIVNRKTDMVRKAGKLQRFFARMLIDHISLLTSYAKVLHFQGVTFQKRVQLL